MSDILRRSSHLTLSQTIFVSARVTAAVKSFNHSKLSAASQVSQWLADFFYYYYHYFTLFHDFILTTRQCRYAWFNIMTLFMFFCVLPHLRNREPVNVPIKQKPGPPHLHPVWSDCNKSCICLPSARLLLCAHLLKSSPLPSTYGLNRWRP